MFQSLFIVVEYKCSSCEIFTHTCSLPRVALVCLWFLASITW